MLPGRSADESVKFQVVGFAHELEVGRVVVELVVVDVVDDVSREDFSSDHLFDDPAVFEYPCCFDGVVKRLVAVFVIAANDIGEVFFGFWDGAGTAGGWLGVFHG